MNAEFKKMVLAKRAERLDAERGSYRSGPWMIYLREYTHERFPDRGTDTPTWYADARMDGDEGAMGVQAVSGAGRAEVEEKIAAALASPRAQKFEAAMQSFTSRQRR